MKLRKNTDPNTLYDNIFAKYRQAVGRIRCTYVEFYTNKGEKIFSLQYTGYGLYPLSLKENICTATYTVADYGQLVPVVVTEKIRLLMWAISGNPKENTPAIEYARNHYKDGIFYVKPNAIYWQGVPGTEIPPVTDDSVKVDNRAAKIALGIAALSFLTR